jgi:hypothetical protein
MVMGAATSALIGVFEPYGHPALVMGVIMTVGVLLAAAAFLREVRAEAA